MPGNRGVEGKFDSLSMRQRYDAVAPRREVPARSPRTAPVAPPRNEAPPRTPGLEVAPRKPEADPVKVDVKKERKGAAVEDPRTYVRPPRAARPADAAAPPAAKPPPAPAPKAEAAPPPPPKAPVAEASGKDASTQAAAESETLKAYQSHSDVLGAMKQSINAIAGVADVMRQGATLSEDDKKVMKNAIAEVNNTIKEHGDQWGIDAKKNQVSSDLSDPQKIIDDLAKLAPQVVAAKDEIDAGIAQMQGKSGTAAPAQPPAAEQANQAAAAPAEDVAAKLDAYKSHSAVLGEVKKSVNAIAGMADAIKNGATLTEDDKKAMNEAISAVNDTVSAYGEQWGIDPKQNQISNDLSDPQKIIDGLAKLAPQVVAAQDEVDAGIAQMQGQSGAAASQSAAADQARQAAAEVDAGNKALGGDDIAAALFAAASS